MVDREQIRAFIIENFLFGDRNGLQDDDSFREKGIIDSTGILELIAFLEQESGMRIEDDEIIPENLDSVNRIEHFMTMKSEGKVAPHLMVNFG